MVNNIYKFLSDTINILICILIVVSMYWLIKRNQEPNIIIIPIKEDQELEEEKCHSDG